MARARKAALLLALCPCAFALDPALDVSQYGHKAWLFRDGFAQGLIRDIAQTSDGYIWFATDVGLFRFDGVKATAWQPPTGQSLPSNIVVKLLAASDGTLWIGTLTGLASWKDGNLTQHEELDGFYGEQIIEDHQGSIWASGNSPSTNGKLCEIRSGKTSCETGDTHPGRVFSLYEDHKGNLWVGTGAGLWRWRPGPQEFFPLKLPNGIGAITEDERDGILIGMQGRVGRLVGRDLQTAYSPAAALRKYDAQRMFRDRDGGVWIGTQGGIEHIHQGRADVFLQQDGLSGDNVGRLFEDTEGNIWVATAAGLDRFRELPIVTYSKQQGLSNKAIGQILGARDGSLWFASFDGLNRLKDGRPILYRPAAEAPVAGVTQIALSGFSKSGLGALLEDSRGRIWLPTFGGVGYLEDNRYVATASPGGPVYAAAEDDSGDLWVANRDLGLLRVSPGKPVERIPWSTLGHKDSAMEMIRDPGRGGLWLGFTQGGIAWFRDGRVQETYSVVNGLGKGRVYHLRFDRDGALWVGTDGGLSRLKEGRIATLTTANGLPCDTVQWSTEDGSESIWMHTACGLLRVPREDLEAWAAAADKTGPKIRATVFDSSGGVRLATSFGSMHPYFAKTPDGKLWFGTLEGLSEIDPRHIPYNKLPPPVQVESVKIDGKETGTTEGLELSHSAKKLEIAYTALSFRDPDRVRFKYKLEGQDADWVDAGTRRVAYYNDLSPRQYRFRVMASNDSGVWNEAGATWNFRVVPAYYQTSWFRASCVAAFFALLAGLYRLRVKQVEKHLAIRMEERVNERTRIARDLHDTLLQSFQGVLLKFYAATYKVADDGSRAELEGVIEQARSAIAEGRDAVQGLRSSATVTNDLARAIGQVGQEFAAHLNGAAFDLQVVGQPRELVPIVRDEAYRIGCEALRNAFLHAQARRIEVEIQYEPRRFRMRVRDNGKGIDPKVLKEGGRAGHHGIPGMHERAKLVGGKLAVWSELDSGAEIELTISGSVAYSKKTPDKESHGRHPDSDGRRSSAV